MITFSLAKLHRKQGAVVKIATLYRPYRDWRYLLVVLFLGFAASVSASLYVFAGVKSGDLFGSSNMPTQTTDDGGKAALQGVVNVLEKRVEDAPLLRERVGKIVDPS